MAPCSHVIAVAATIRPAFVNSRAGLLLGSNPGPHAEGPGKRFRRGGGGRRAGSAASVHRVLVRLDPGEDLPLDFA